MGDDLIERLRGARRKASALMHGMEMIGANRTTMERVISACEDGAAIIERLTRERDEAKRPENKLIAGAQEAAALSGARVHIDGAEYGLEGLIAAVRALAASQAREAEMREALREAERHFDVISDILIDHLEDPERLAFWAAIKGRGSSRAALAPAAQQAEDGEPAAVEAGSPSEALAAFVTTWTEEASRAGAYMPALATALRIAADEMADLYPDDTNGGRFSVSPAQEETRRAEAPPMPMVWGRRWRHQKTGGTYVVVGTGIIEADLAPAVAYKSETTGTVWFRPHAEFMDGRFVCIDDEKPGGFEASEIDRLNRAAQAEANPKETDNG